MSQLKSGILETSWLISGITESILFSTCLQELWCLCQCFSGTSLDSWILNCIRELLTLAVQVRSGSNRFSQSYNQRHLLVSFFNPSQDSWNELAHFKKFLKWAGSFQEFLKWASSNQEFLIWAVISQGKTVFSEGMYTFFLPFDGPRSSSCIEYSNFAKKINLIELF